MSSPSAPWAALQSPTHAAVAIREFSGESAREWDAFVCRHPAATFFHGLAWKAVIERTFGYAPKYFYTEREGRITGIAPCFLVENWITGKCLVSVPWATYGGVCAEDSESEQLLLRRIDEFARSERVQYVELRNRTALPLAELHTKSLYVTFTAELKPDVEAMIKLLPKDTRYMIRKGQKAGLQARHGLEQMDAFYELFAVSMSRFGTPLFPRALFDNMAREFQPNIDLMLVYSGSQPVSGVLSFYFRDTVLPYYAGALPDANKVAANNFMYWELMRESAEAGMRGFDFGRSKVNTGAYAFKTTWNTHAEPLPYQYLLVKRKQLPNFSPANPKFDLAARLWRKLPIPVTKWVGPHVVKWFP